MTGTIKINDLTAAGSALSTMQLETDIAGTTSNKVTMPQVKTFTAIGSIDASSVASGQIGEIISSTVASGSAVALTTGTSVDITSITLTAGNWLFFGHVVFTAGGATTVTNETVFIGTASGNNTTGRDTAVNTSRRALGATSASDDSVNLPSGVVVRITTPTTYYMKANTAFSVSTLAGFGYFGAIRFS